MKLFTPRLSGQRGYHQCPMIPVQHHSPALKRLGNTSFVFCDNGDRVGLMPSLEASLYSGCVDGIFIHSLPCAHSGCQWTRGTVHSLSRSASEDPSWGASVQCYQSRRNPKGTSKDTSQLWFVTQSWSALWFGSHYTQENRDSSP